MANVATVVIEVDDQGAVQSLKKLDTQGKETGASLEKAGNASGKSFENLNSQAKQLDPSLQRAGKQGNVVFTQMTKDTEHAHQAALLMNETLGLRIPRALTTVIAKTPGVATAFTTAFSTVAILAFAAELARLVSDFDEARTAGAKFANAVVIAGQQVKEFFGFGEGFDLRQKRRLEELQFSLPLIDKARQTEHQASLATLQGLAAIEEKRKQAKDDISVLEQLQIEAAKKQFSDTQRFADALGKIEEARVRSEKAADEQAAAETIALHQKEKIAIIQARGEEKAAALRGLEEIRAQTETILKGIAEQEKQGVITKQLAEAQKAAAVAKRTRQEEDFAIRLRDFNRQIAVSGQAAILQAEAATASGREQIEKQFIARLNAITQEEISKRLELLKEGIDREIVLTDQRNAALMERDHALTESRRKAIEDTRRMEEDAAVAILPPWRRANAQLILDYNRRVREINEALRKTEIDEAQAARQIGAEWQKTFAQMRDNLANDLETLFDDITSGNIGQTFLKLFKKMVFEMVASWILGMNQMRSASQGAFGAGGGGILGSLFAGFGSLFGLGSIFGRGSPIGPGGTAPFIGGGSPAGSAASFGFFPGASAGATGSAAAAAGIVSPFGLSGLNGLGLSATPGASVPGTILPAGAQIGSFNFSALKSLQGINTIAGLVGSLLLGTGNIALNALGGALLGGSIGAGIGSLIGGLGVFLGPIGAIVGFIGGLLGGIFGRGKRRREINRIQKQLAVDIQKIKDAFNNFQIDAGGAHDQLEQLRKSYRDAFHKLGADSRGRTDPGIDAAEKYVAETEAERQRRAALVFGPAQFRQGGFVRHGMAQGIGYVSEFLAAAGGRARGFAGGGAVASILHEGEFVLRPEAVRRIGRGRLESMNSGASSGGGGDVHIHVNALDAKSFAEWLRAGAIKDLRFEILRAVREGR